MTASTCRSLNFDTPNDNGAGPADEPDGRLPVVDADVRRLSWKGVHPSALFQKCSKTLRNGAERGCFLSESGCKAMKGNGRCGTPGVIRTPDPLLRRRGRADCDTLRWLALSRYSCGFHSSRACEAVRPMTRRIERGVHQNVHQISGSFSRRVSARGRAIPYPPTFRASLGQARAAGGHLNARRANCPRASGVCSEPLSYYTA